jgi:hypothetical protein
MHIKISVSLVYQALIYRPRVLSRFCCYTPYVVRPSMGLRIAYVIVYTLQLARKGSINRALPELACHYQTAASLYGFVCTLI